MLAGIQHHLRDSPIGWEGSVRSSIEITPLGVGVRGNQSLIFGVLSFVFSTCQPMVPRLEESCSGSSRLNDGKEVMRLTCESYSSVYRRACCRALEGIDT